MISKLNRWLLVLFAAQLIAAATIYLVNQNGDSNFEAVPLLAFEKSELTKLEISQADEQEAADNSTLVLSKQGGKWVLPQLNDLPVNQVKFDLAIAKLMGLKTNWPVATTNESHSRFEVAEDKFQKKVQIFAADKTVAELFLGTSPGFKKVHLRKSGFDEVYSLELNSYEFSNEANDWLDKGLLQIESPNKISFNDFSLQNKDDQWQLLPTTLVSDDKQLDSAQVESIVSKLASLNVTGVAEDSTHLDSADSYIIEIEADKNYQLTFYKKDSGYWVKRDDIKTLFTVSSTDYKAFVEASAEQFLKDLESSQDNVDATSNESSDEQSEPQTEIEPAKQKPEN